MDRLFGARQFVEYAKEHSQGYEPTYQKFMDLVSEMNEKMLNRFEEEVGEMIANGMGEK